MIDLHSHILPSIDDGAASTQMSLDMLDTASAMGFRTIVATPHLVERLAPAYESRVQDAFRDIQACAHEKGIELISGFEVRLLPDLPKRLLCGEPIALGQSRAVLIDLPFIDWPYYVDNVLFEVQTAGFQPILAHPERYPKIQNDPSIGLKLAERGIALQVTIGSFSGIFGKRAKRTAEELIALGAVHLVAADAHSAGHRLAAVPQGLQRLAELVGDDAFQTLTGASPRALLAGGPFPIPVTGLNRSWPTRILNRAHLR